MNDDSDSVWNSLEDDPARIENLRLRSELMIQISEAIRKQELNQKAAARVLGVSQPRVSALLQGRVDKFRLDSLVEMAHHLGIRMRLVFAKSALPHQTQLRKLRGKYEWDGDLDAMRRDK